MYPRFASARVEQALADTRVVLLAGPRQAGKTTLAKALADDLRAYQTLDNASLNAKRLQTFYLCLWTWIPKQTCFLRLPNRSVKEINFGNAMESSHSNA